MKHTLYVPSAALRPSACPGLLRIVQAKDGGICRIKLACGRLEAAQAERLAEAANRHAGGVIEATNRANLQIRGIRAGTEDALIAELLEAGLGPASAGADDVRNLMVSPAAGLDPAALVDVSPLAAQVLATLENTPRLHALSPKFALLLDGGERLAMLEHPHDIWLSAMHLEGRTVYAFGLAGCPPVAADDAPALAAVPEAHAHDLVLALLDLFLELATPEQTRMRHLLVTHSPSELLQRLGERLGDVLLTADDWRRGPAAPQAHIGIGAQRQTGRLHVGGVPPLGRLEADQLLGLAALARRLGDGSLRLTPWQSVLLPNVAASDAEAVLQGLQRLGLICTAEHPLAHLIACTGSAGCAKGLADTKGDARQLAERLACASARPGIHLSGCSRSCAAAHRAPLTLLAVAEGRYDLFARRADSSDFGQPLARHLSLEEAGDLLASLPDTWSSSR
ncbi:precorrin-3B synthase [Phytopseudomonas dryadis]|uniref:Precorrin-3B synthase n=1 Tax=Phytopseudomonas dryadis TaxID=2487520 RepID=A0A4Q9R1S7_9GAMM|nr:MULTISPECIES: precorrin-3B synthase [Pseudomonas]TBU92074.1 precorrin-3B synthase [Pseudomonas dryadis]TBV05013.1 precorrin-3B synthase [Pseudomonas dryadis]TBV16416.1 precorrin-3B synthase [Pseudomonas sp. FRB 230]